MPERCGESPVKIAVREGLHEGAAQWALLNKMPEAASRSKFGVRACGCPPRQPTQSFRSSIAMKRILGLAAASVFTTEAQSMRIKVRMRKFIISMARLKLEIDP